MWLLGAVAVYAALIAVELSIAVVQRSRVYRARDSLCSLTMGCFYLATQALMRGFLLMLMYLAHDLTPLDLGGGWIAFAACYVAMDFLVYCYHRFTHEVRFAWAAHVASIG